MRPTSSSSPSTAPSVLVIGVGNRYRSDDAAGLEAVRILRNQGLRAAEFEGEPIGLLDIWEGAGFAIVIDAVSSGADAGTIQRLDATVEPLPASVAGAPSTHAVGLGQAIELGRALGRLPGKLIVYGIEGDSFTAGEELSPRVAEALKSLVEQVHHEVLHTADGGAEGPTDDA